DSVSAFLQVAACEDNISKWKAYIFDYEAKIVEAKNNIAEDENRKRDFEAQATAVPKSRINEISEKGIQHYSETFTLQVEINRLGHERDVLQCKLALTQDLYQKFKRDSLG
ncbi:hypothetical protein A2U01_0065709, partial [Trifolium medium]|nr:hypothetical protein [Trifolium medium]